MKKSDPFDFNFSSHPFITPGYLTCELPEVVREELKESIEKAKKNKIDYRGKLAGNVSKEFELKITPTIKYLTESMAKEYFKIFGDKISFYEDSDFKLKSLWLNIQKKHEFNPIHSHSGVFSFVIWVKIPYDIEEELKMFKHSNSPSASLFSFVYHDSFGTTHTKEIHIGKSHEWSMAFFPSNLPHTVYPFYTSDDVRMSISGNIFYNRKKS